MIITICKQLLIPTPIFNTNYFSLCFKYSYLIENGNGKRREDVGMNESKLKFDEDRQIDW